jgi:hypothetical protein
MAVSTIQNASLASGVPSSANMPVGSVLQVVGATYNTYVSTTSTSFTDTGLSASITPKFATSKIVIFISINGINGSGVPFTFNISNGSNTQILSVMDNNLTGNAGFSASASVIDSPATTSSCTYKVRYKANTAGTIYINNYITTNGNTGSSITLMEIAV